MSTELNDNSAEKLDKNIHKATLIILSIDLKGSKNVTGWLRDIY